MFFHLVAILKFSANLQQDLRASIYFLNCKYESVIKQLLLYLWLPYEYLFCLIAFSYGWASTCILITSVIRDATLFSQILLYHIEIFINYWFLPSCLIELLYYEWMMFRCCPGQSLSDPSRKVWFTKIRLESKINWIKLKQKRWKS